MDTNKCYDYVSSNDIRSHGTFVGNRDIQSSENTMAVTQNQYYNNSLTEHIVPPNSTNNNVHNSMVENSLLGEKRKICGCNRNVSRCNGCRLQTPDIAVDVWPTKMSDEYSQRGDYSLRNDPSILSNPASSTQQSAKKSIRLSPIYLQQQQKQQQQQQKTIPHFQSQQQQSQPMASQKGPLNMDGNGKVNNLADNGKVNSLNRDASLHNNNNNNNGPTNNLSMYWSPAIGAYVNDDLKTNPRVQTSLDVNVNRRSDALLDIVKFNPPNGANLYNNMQPVPSSQSLGTAAKIIPQQEQQPLSTSQSMVPISMTNSKSMNNQQQQQRICGNVNAAIYGNVADVMPMNKDRIYDASNYTSNIKNQHKINTSSNINMTPIYNNNNNNNNNNNTNTHQFYEHQQQQSQCLQYHQQHTHQQNVLHNHHYNHHHHNHNNHNNLNIPNELNKSYSKSNHIVNPTNLPTSKDQQPSPNYAKKCPQIFSPEEQSIKPRHHLYMSTPQFSSDKFTTTAHQKQQLHIADNNNKIKENFISQRQATEGAIGAPIFNGNSTYISPNIPDKYHKLRDTSQQQYHIPPSDESPALSYAQSSANYYNTINPSISSSSRNSSVDHLPLKVKQQMAQQHSHRQYPPYNKNCEPTTQLSLPSRQQKSMASQSTKNVSPPIPLEPRINNHSPVIDYVKREDVQHIIYENPSSHTLQGSRNMYSNPYNTPPPTATDTYIKEVIHSGPSSPYMDNAAAGTSTRVDSPICYPTKYARLPLADTSTFPISGKHHNIINQNTPPPSRAPSQRSQQQSGYYYDGNYHSSVPSPAVATAASPSPSSLLSTTSHTQLQQNDYVVSQMRPSVPSGPTMPISSSHLYTENTYANTHRHQNSPMIETFDSHEKLLTSPSQQSQEYHQYSTNNNSKYQQQIRSTTVKTVTPQMPLLKAQTTIKQQKPNYRELINEKIAERNATSEEELNLQIIKKTLNVNPQAIRNSHESCRPTNGTESNNMPLVSQTSTLAPITSVINERVPPTVRQDILIQPTQKKPPTKKPAIIVSQVRAVIPNPTVNVNDLESNHVIPEQITEKPACSSSPLDLSIRTVKTKADSTEYTYQQKHHYQQTTPPLLMQQNPTSIHSMKQIVQTSDNSARTSTQIPDNHYTLPRVDFTPNFALHTLESTQPLKDTKVITNRANVTTERINYIQNNTSPSIAHFKDNNNYSQNTILPVSIPVPIPISVSIPHHHYNNSSTSNNNNNNNISSRPPILKGEQYSTPSTTNKSNTNFTCNNTESMFNNHHTDNRNIEQQNNPNYRCVTATAVQSRPSVVETNPYASVIKMETSKTSAKHHSLGVADRVVDRLPPDTSIMALPSRNICNLDNIETPHIAHIGAVTTINTTNVRQTALMNSSACEKNLNFLGRKRHLQVYSNREKASSPKRTCCPDLQETNYIKVTETSTPHIRPVDISVIAVNASALPPCSMDKRFPICPKNEMKSPAPILTPVITTATQPTNETGNNHNTLASAIVCKDESIKIENTKPIAAKTEPPIITYATSSNVSNFGSQQQAAARIRTKAELKGFTFNTPPILASNNNCLRNSYENKLAPIKQEDAKKIEIKIEKENAAIIIKSESELPTTITNLNEKSDENSLADYGFNDACKNFMEQLQARITNPASKRLKVTSNNRNMRLDNKCLMVDAHQLNLNDDIQRLSQTESPETSRSSPLPYDCAGNDSASVNSKCLDLESQNSSQTSSNAQKKITKSERDKKRFQQEKRLAERLQIKESSSESEDELDKRKTERLKKPTLKSKIKQQNNRTTNNRIIISKGYTDCGDKNHFTEYRSDSTNDNTGEDTNGSIKKHNVNVNVNNIKLEKNGKLHSKHNLTLRDCVTGEEKNENERKKIRTIFKIKNHEIIINRNEKSSMKMNKEETYESLSESDNDELQEEPEGDKIKKYKKSLNESNIKNQGKSSSRKMKFNKFAVNTMTRSKLKKELETQLANSKVLRNDKIIRNSTNKIKRKYVRKFGNNVASGTMGTDEAGGLSREAGIIKSKRLKAKIEHNGNYKSGTAQKMKANSVADVKNEGKMKKKQSNDIMLEVYRFKRSLKVPPSLINIKHPSGNCKIAASLPDLECHAEILEKKKKKSMIKMKSESGSIKAYPLSKSAVQAENKHISIIDLLHSRVTKYSEHQNISSGAKKLAGNGTVKKVPKSFNSYKSNSMNNFGVHSETSQTTVESSELQMLPALKKDSDDEDGDDNELHNSSNKKRHFSIFDTKVLAAKTRNEWKRQQKRENIREIFVGDDRPASAPPEIAAEISEGVGDCNVSKQTNKRMTYEQKYEQFLQQMNIVINEDKFGRFNRASRITPTTVCSSITQDLDGASKNSCAAGNNELNFGNGNKNVTAEPSVKELCENDCKSVEAGSENFRKRRRPGKYLRRKGSSGFDYIKKKKKKPPQGSGGAGVRGSLNATTTTAVTSTLSRAKKHHNMERLSEGIVKMKTEDDVSREIQKWVLNKGVGQSAMHKAARQGYIDVIVYCLDRLGMNPDMKDNAGYTPLHEACTNGWLNIARVLLQYGANHSSAAHSGIRPLHEASENDHEEIVRLLLSYGADPLLATYSGQTPLMLAASSVISDLITNHLNDVQSNVNHDRKAWTFDGPWRIFDPLEYGYNILEGAPTYAYDMRRSALRKSSSSVITLHKNKKLQKCLVNVYNNSSIQSQTIEATSGINYYKNCSNNKEAENTIATISNEEKDRSTADYEITKSYLSAVSRTTIPSKQLQLQKSTYMDKCAVVLDNIDRFSTFRLLNETNPEILVENSDSEGEIVEFEESDVLLPPLYLLNDESHTDKWVLLSDLCNLLKVKSKETLLNKIYPSSPTTSTALPKGLMRELKTSDFLEKTTCLQLLCAGEKLNLNASKVVLIKYNENVRNLLGVNAFLMKL